MHAVADISKNLPMGTVLERQEQGQQQSTVPNVFSLFKNMLRVDGWTETRRMSKTCTWIYMHNNLYLITDVLRHSIVSISCCWWQFHFFSFLQTPVPVSVRVYRCILKKKCSLRSKPVLGAVFVRCNVCDIIILLCFLQDDLVQCLIDCEDRGTPRGSLP